MFSSSLDPGPLQLIPIKGTYVPALLLPCFFLKSVYWGLFHLVERLAAIPLKFFDPYFFVRKYLVTLVVGEAGVETSLHSLVLVLVFFPPGVGGSAVLCPYRADTVSRPTFPGQTVPLAFPGL